MSTGMRVQDLMERLGLGSVGLRARNSALIASGKLACSLVWLVATVLTARHLGPESYGILALALALSGLMVPLASAGLEQIAVREMVRNPERAERIAASALCLRLAGAVLGLCFAVTLAATGAISPSADPALTLLACIFLFASAFDALSGLMVARERFLTILAAQLFAALVNLGAVIILVSTDAGTAAFAAAKAIEWILFICCILLATAAAGTRISQLVPEPARLLGLMRLGLPLLLTAAAFALFSRMDQLMIAALASDEELGLYGVATRLAEALRFVPVAIATAFYAHLTRLREGSEAAFLAEMQVLFDTMTTASIAMATAVMLFAAVLLVPVFGEAFSDARGMVAILALSIPFAALGVARTVAFTISGQTWLAFRVWMLAVAVNFAGNAALVPTYGGEGAAVATALSLVAAHLGTSFLFPSLRGYGRAMIRALNPFAAVSRTLRRLRGR